MSRSFYHIEFRTASGWQVGHTTTTLRVARKRLGWYAGEAWCLEARIVRGGLGGEVVT